MPILETITVNNITYDIVDAEARAKEYELAVDENVSVGKAKTGSAKTGTPNYTPSGSVDLQGTTAQAVTDVELDYIYFNGAITIQGISATKTSVTNVTSASFSGNGVAFTIQEKEQA